MNPNLVSTTSGCPPIPYVSPGPLIPGADDGRSGPARGGYARPHPLYGGAAGKLEHESHVDAVIRDLFSQITTAVPKDRLHELADRLQMLTNEGA